jgi:hypothetical protein
MNGPIVILPLAAGVYLARNDRGLSAEGSTPEEALAKLREVTERWLAEYRKTMVTPPPPPAGATSAAWVAWTGSRNPDDPLMEEWARAVEEYRARIDADPEIH